MLSNGRFIKIYIQKKNILSRVVTIGYNQSCSQTSHKQLIENTKTHRRFFCGFKFSLKKEGGEELRETNLNANVVSASTLLQLERICQISLFF